MSDYLLDNVDVEEYKDIMLMDREARTNIGVLANLKTSVKTDLVSAINDVINIDKIFVNIAEMTASDIDAGEVAIVVGKYPSYWKIEDVGTPSLVCREMDNGKYAKLLNKTPINIGALNEYQNYDNITTDVQYLINNGYKHVIIPEGIYYCSVNVPNNCIIEGENEYTVSLLPYNHGSIFYIGGDNIELRNMYLTDEAPYSGVGINVNTAVGCHNSRFHNLHIENLNEGFLATTDMIWNQFYDCDFLGCFDHGFVITSPTAFFNNNAFYSCKFNNNVNAGIVIDVTDQHDYDNNFYSCNIEYNAQDRFGITHTDNYAVLSTGFTTFHGCYFEGNGSSNTDVSILNFDQLNLMGCVFIQERILVGNDNASITNFIGCKQYQCAGYTSTTLQPVNTFGNNFTI